MTAMTAMQQYRPWRFLVLLVTLVLLLIIQPMVRGFSVRGPALDVLYSLVLVAAILSFCDRRWPRRAVVVLGVSALAAKWLTRLLVGSGDSLCKCCFSCSWQR
jgi:hypothetical protein